MKENDNCDISKVLLFKKFTMRQHSAGHKSRAQDKTRKQRAQRRFGEVNSLFCLIVVAIATKFTIDQTLLERIEMVTFYRDFQLYRHTLWKEQQLALSCRQN